MRALPLVVILLLFSLLLFFFGTIDVFSVGDQGLKQMVLLDLRLPKILTAIAAGGMLALCGLLLQTYFLNPLAGPYVLGIHGGASLGIALWIFLSGAAFSFELFMGLGPVFMGLLGSFIMMGLLTALSRYLPNRNTLIIVGILMGLFTNGILTLFVSLVSSDQLRSFYYWTLGSFSHLDLKGSLFLLLFSFVIFGVVRAFATKLNLLLMGEHYAQSLGLDLKKFRLFLIFTCSLIIGIVVSFCGPIAFIGLISPHLARLTLKSNDHRVLALNVFLMGAILALMAEFLFSGTKSLSLPLNAGLSLMGIPLFFGLFILPRNALLRRKF